MTLKITLIPSPTPRSIAETVLSYNVYLGSLLYGEVFYTRAGYVGKLPLPGQRTISLDGITVPHLRQSVSRANHQWEQFSEPEAGLSSGPGLAQIEPLALYPTLNLKSRANM